MATLHVRNVPDELYERLRANAAANERSIGAEVVFLLEEELSSDRPAPRRRFPGALRRRPATATPFERFSPRSRQVIIEAQEAAEALGAPGLGTEHLLLALFRDPPTLALMVLNMAGVEEAAVRATIESEGEGATEPPSGGMPFTPGAKKALELGLREYITTGDVQIQPEHLLVGISAEGEGLGARILSSAGQTTQQLRDAICMPRALPAFAQFQPQQGFRVLELTGEAGDWEKELNTFAARGYSLVEIVNGRAIFAISMSGP
jgi:plasmid stability protein